MGRCNDLGARDVNLNGACFYQNDSGGCNIDQDAWGSRVALGREAYSQQKRGRREMRDGGSRWTDRAKGESRGETGPKENQRVGGTE